MGAIRKNKVQNLKFIEALLFAAGKSKSSMAEALGMTKQNFQNYFKKDDIKLSKALAVADNLGYSLAFRYDKDGGSVPNSSAIPEIRVTGAKRLAFLAVAVSVYDMDTRDICSRLGFSGDRFSTWLTKDDIFVSYLYVIAEMYDLRLVIDIDLKK